MNIRLTPFRFTLAALVVVSTLLADNPTMKDKNQKETAPSACALDGAKSACGLPSKVVIDLSKAKVQRTDAEWRTQLTAEQFRVARQQGTEPPFRNEYWNNHEDGVYFSVCSDPPLFDSRDKFDSGTGWPSFTQPIEPAFVGETKETSAGMARHDVRCGGGGG